MIRKKGEHICYLLGAGASASALPVVDQLPDRIKKSITMFKSDFADKITDDFEVNGNISAKSVNNLVTDKLLWLAKNAGQHSSIDTFAKKLFLQSSSEYDDLKLYLSMYFARDQWNTGLDLRYDNFWASILDKKDEFPKRIKMVSWNYDSQIEQSFLNFSDCQSLLECTRKLNIVSPNCFSDFPNHDDFAIFKLNGSASLKTSTNNKFYSDNYKGKDYVKFYTDLFESHKLVIEKQNESNLSFAWEHSLKDDYFVQLKKSLWKTSVLVVIGYSFPFFNRTTDDYLINECMPSLSKVYIQAPDAEDLAERFSSISPIDKSNIILNKDTRQFAFPNEL